MAQPKLLSRSAFSTETLARLGGRCCVPGCSEPAADAHHLIDRSLFPDGGYYLDNGAPLCSRHHLEAERTTLSPDELRGWTGIKQVILPPQFEDDERIDKWGNPILGNGTRLKGEMFFDEPVQKALAAGGVLDLFRPYVKYPKTWHMESSPGVGRGDRVLRDLSAFIGQRVIGTEKRDGECTTMYPDHIHARSLDSRHHPSRDWIKGFWNAIRSDIPHDFRVCGENTYAVHSIRYEALPTWFEGFSVWNERNEALSWDETLEYFDLIGSSSGLSITPVPVFYDGIFDLDAIHEAWEKLLAADRAQAALTGQPVQAREGYVVRTAAGFRYRDFRNHVAKWVRAGHVQTDSHWMHGEIVPNGIQRSG
ncbi:RNA ligase family protein (plasmid) [Bosea sp. RAC05]|nr:RNA ligase family protein [Bosea sp. RAC05]